MDQEMVANCGNQTWVLKYLLLGKKAIPCKWVYKVEQYADGTVDKFKIRLVINAFSQQTHVDYDPTFSFVQERQLFEQY